MMQEVSAIIANDPQMAEELSEEEILACLVADSETFFAVPTKKAKLRECQLQIMHDEAEDPLEKYLKENKRLQQASLRLEQENDNLAHRLITSKVALRGALDQAEDQADQLSKELNLTKHELQAVQEQMQQKEEEAAKLKDVFRSELENADQNIQRSSGIIADYKQICSQLTERLERQQAAHRQQMNSIKSALKACSSCSHVLEVTSKHQDEDRSTVVHCLEVPNSSSTEMESFREQIRELEQELAQTKLQMVEAKCRIQELEHEAGVLNGNLQDARNNWLSKAFTSLRSSDGPLQLPTGPTHHQGLLTGPLRRSGEAKEALHIFSRTSLKTPTWIVKKISWPHRDHHFNE